MALKVSIQGYEGSFHQVAAQAFFGKGVEVVPCATFREVVRLAGAQGPADGGVMAIENSIAGSILPNYNLLQKSNLHVVGEVYLQIHQNLLVNRGVSLEDIREVHSHPMALLQCLDYLDQYNWKLVETEDTALSAKHIHKHKSRHIAAIASTLAAELYDLDVIAPKIQSEKANYTRFLVLQNGKAQLVEDANKASLYFQVAHSSGSLARVLTLVAEGGVNLSKLQSFPVPGSNWKYSFHADMEFESVDQFHAVMEKITPLTEAIKVYGIYKKEKRFDKHINVKHMQVANRLKPINEYYFSQKLREIEVMNGQGEPVINLGIGSPDGPPHPSVIQVLQQESSKPQVHAYQGYKGVKPLREAIAAWYATWYGVTLNADTEVLPLIGSKEGIMHICMTFLNEGDAALVPNPGYPTYRSAVQLAGATCLDYELKEESGWMPDFEALENSDLSKVKLMWVNYPHMPTGQLPTQELFEKLIQFGKKHNILICHDNPYSFILNEKPQSLLAVAGAKEVALELNSLSKSHNMAGWRVGILCGAKENIEAVLRFKSNMDSGMFMPLQLAAAQALTLGKDWHDGLNAQYAKRREKAFELLDVLGCQYATDQAGMFVWARIPDHFSNGFELSDAVLQGARVFITPGGIFGTAGDRYIRVSLCSAEAVFEKATQKIKNALQTIKVPV